MSLLALTAAALGYLFGSFPSGYLAGRLAGVDVRTVGSGNIGATNVLRVLGKPWGYAVFFVDALKGVLAVRIALFLASRFGVAPANAQYFAILAAAMCVIGHTFPIWLAFKGGKGVATLAGTICGLMPLAAVIISPVWVVVFKTTRYVSLASLAAAVMLPVTVALLIHWKLSEGFALFYYALAMAILVAWRHRSNFSRLLNRTEQRFSRK